MTKRCLNVYQYQVAAEPILYHFVSKAKANQGIYDIPIPLQVYQKVYVVGILWEDALLLQVWIWLSPISRGHILCVCITYMTF